MRGSLNPTEILTQHSHAPSNGFTAVSAFEHRAPHTVGGKVSILSLQFVSRISVGTLVTSKPLARPTTVATLPSALGLSVSCARCKLGVLVFSRHCNLIFDLLSISRWNWAKRGEMGANLSPTVKHDQLQSHGSRTYDS
jgi:hypothetical protein